MKYLIGFSLSRSPSISACPIVLLACGILEASAILLSSPVRADQSQPEAASNDSSPNSGVETITVTAERRSENIMSVPLAVSAVTGDTLQEANIVEPRQLAQLVNGLQFYNTGPTSVYAIRGVTLNDFGDSNESPIAFYRDDVYLAALAGTQTQMFDIDHVEVLRGPQGTLFGRNATGGVVQVISNKPTDDFSGDASLQYGSYNQVIATGAVNIPVTDKILTRTAFNFDRDDGWQYDATTNTRLAKANEWAMRELIDVNISQAWTAEANFHIGVNRDIAPGYGFEGTYIVSTGGTCTQAQIASNSPQCTSYDGFHVADLKPGVEYSHVAAPPLDIENTGGSLTVKYSAGPAFNFTSISAYEFTTKLYEEDASANPEYEFNTFYNADRKQYSQEFRIDGSDGPLRWVGGLFYFNEHLSHGLFNLVDLVALYGTYGLENQFTQRTSAGAAFGQVDYDILPDVTLTAGARYSVETKTLNISDNYAAPTYINQDSANADVPTWKATVTWHVDPDWLTYATISTGFKSPAFNTSGAVAGGSAASNPEKNTNYEIGTKLTAWNDQVDFTAAAYYDDYRALQLVDAAANEAIPTPTLLNLPKATIYGGESEINAKPLPQLFVNLNATWTLSQISAPGYFLTPVSLNGLPVTNTPTVTLKGYVKYDIDAGSLGYVSPRVDFDYQSHMLPTLSCTYYTACIVPGYVIFDANISWMPVDGRYGIEVFADNLFNKVYETYSFQVADVNAIQWGKPRTIGIRISANY